MIYCIDVKNLFKYSFTEGEMGSDDEIKLRDNQVIKARPDINEISKRNEIEEKKEKKIIYIRTGIIILLIAVALIYFSTK